MTIKDIARISGFGVSTVSRALNGHPDISEETRKKIQDVAKKYNFVPNANARRLKAASSKTIDIIVKGTFNVFFSQLIENLQSEIYAAGFMAGLHYINTDENEVETAKALMMLEKPLGIVFLGGNLMNFDDGFARQVPVPCVLSTTTAVTSRLENLSSVSVDDADGGKRAIDYLISCGHRKIGIIGGDIKTFCATGQRYGGCLESFAENGVYYDEGWFEYCDFTLESSYEAAKRLITRAPELTAIFAMSDSMAIGAIRAVNDLGLSVPDDISVLGFDGIDIASFYNPRVTTFAQPLEQIASLTASMIKTMLKEKTKPEHILLKSQLKSGGSVKKLN